MMSKPIGMIVASTPTSVNEMVMSGTLSPTLTTLDSAIFDADVIAEMESHIDDLIVCQSPECEHPAAWRLTMRCCNDSTLVCSSHAIRFRIFLSVLLAERRVGCGVCACSFDGLTAYEDVVREVLL